MTASDRKWDAKPFPPLETKEKEKKTTKKKINKGK